MQNKKCKCCNTTLIKDWIALNKKLLSTDAKDYYCISCLADTLGCEVEDLNIKIEEFKEQGCTLFK